jgi:hypothetical protein
MMEHYALPSITERRICGLIGRINAVGESRESFASNNDAQDDNAFVEASQRKKKSNTE